MPYSDFAEWLDLVLTWPMPQGIRAFNFNLYEDGEDPHLFAVQLIGSPKYDPILPDWACEELFTTGEYLFLLRDTDWLSCLRQAEDLIRRYLVQGRERKKLLSARAVAAGFVDGDLVTIRDAEENKR